MLMRMLSAGGLPLVTDGERPADNDNPLGYFEYEPVKKLGQSREWVAEAAGKAVKVISMLLRELPVDCRYRVLFSERDMDEVLASQAEMLTHRGREPGGDDARMGELFRKHLLQVQGWLAQSEHTDVLYLPYAQTVSDPGAAAERISDFLGGDLDTAAMAAAVDPALYRRRA